MEERKGLTGIFNVDSIRIELDLLMEPGSSRSGLESRIPPLLTDLLLRHPRVLACKIVLPVHDCICHSLGTEASEEARHEGGDGGLNRRATDRVLMVAWVKIDFVGSGAEEAKTADVWQRGGGVVLLRH